MKLKKFYIIIFLFFALLALNSCSEEKNFVSWPQDINYSLLSLNRIKQIMKAKPENVRIVMLGNSITHQGGNWNEILGRNDVYNCGQGGYTTQQFCWLLDSCVFASEPEYCFIMGGINDLSLGVPVERVIANYKNLIKMIQDRNIKVIIQSTLMQSAYSQNNPKVEEINKSLRKYCRDLKIPFIDLNKKMSLKSGLDPELSTDGTHLNVRGYAVWAEILKKWMDKNISSQ
jgi:alpha-glucosidase